MRSALCVLVCVALVGAAPSLLPGDPRLAEGGHHHHGDHHHGPHSHGEHGEHDHSHGEHDHSHGEHDHSHGEHDHSNGEHDHSHGEHDHPHGEHDHPHGEHDHPHGEHDHGEHHHGDHSAQGDFSSADTTGFDLPVADAAPAPVASGGVPDLGYTSDGSDYGVGQVVTSQTGPVRSSFPAQQQQRQPQRSAGNPFFSSNAEIPSFQVAPKPVPARQRPSSASTPSTPPPPLNTNPLGGPAGPKGPVRDSCPGPASALPCVPDEQCDPFTGFLKSDNYKLPYPITKDTPTVAIGQCRLGAGRIGVCCKKFPHPPKPTPPTTAIPLGVDYGQGLPSPKPTKAAPNPFIPGYNP